LYLWLYDDTIFTLAKEKKEEKFPIGRWLVRPWLMTFVGYWVHHNVHRSNDVRFVVETSAVNDDDQS